MGDLTARAVFLISILPLLPLLALAAPASRPAADAVRWRQAATLAAAEANQAAAADEKFVYAIDNARVAKYDRGTGERVAVSTGQAHHLNSGFLFEGRLYCAHSNYPKTPESSQVMVLDPEAMRLSLFKDFGNYGGSLTWALRQGEHWWCNFALYGKNNAETFLVKFDAGWREIGRWTYPPELIRQLGNYSLSGGVWRDGHLLVTGHDEPALYRLRIPEKGAVLELVDTQKAPFTGQGIAHDPVTGGLVGIRRGKGHVVIAVPERPATLPAKR
jgi:hypothetical protein